MRLDNAVDTATAYADAGDDSPLHAEGMNGGIATLREVSLSRVHVRGNGRHSGTAPIRERERVTLAGHLASIND